MSSPIPTTLTQDNSSQDAFASNYDLDNPVAAMSSYARLMHQHTKRQMDMATRSTGRKSDGVSSMGQLAGEGSGDSPDSLQQ